MKEFNYVIIAAQSKAVVLDENKDIIEEEEEEEEEEDVNLSLVAMEAEIKEQILAMINEVAATFKEISTLNDRRLIDQIRYFLHLISLSHTGFLE